MQVGEMCIDVHNDMRMVIVIVQWSGEGDPVRMIWSAYYAISFFVRETWYIANEWPGGFLDDKNVKIYISF